MMSLKTLCRRETLGWNASRFACVVAHQGSCQVRTAAGLYRRRGGGEAPSLSPKKNALPGAKDLCRFNRTTRPEGRVVDQ